MNFACLGIGGLEYYYVNPSGGLLINIVIALSCVQDTE